MSNLQQEHTDFVTSLFPAKPLPLVLEPKKKPDSLSDLYNLIDSHEGFLKENLLKYGGLLLRGFPVQDERDFAGVIKKLNYGNFVDYIGGDSPRIKIYEGVYTSIEAPPNFKIPLHNELSYVKKYPKHIYFYCMSEPEEGGETIVCDARQVYQDIDPDVRARFEKGLHYISCYPYKSKLLNFVNKSHKSWVNVFETEQKSEVYQKCRDNDFTLKWLADDWMKLGQSGPASIPHPETKENVWFNQAHIFDFNPKMLGFWNYVGVKLLYCRKNTLLHAVEFADGTKISRADLYHILDVLDANTVAFRWRRGDVMVLDNVLAMHGRNAFTGKRRILTAMTG